MFPLEVATVFQSVAAAKTRHAHLAAHDHPSDPALSIKALRSAPFRRIGLRWRLRAGRRAGISFFKWSQEKDSRRAQ